LVVFWGTFPQIMSLIVLTKKGPSLGWTRHLSHKPWILAARFELGEEEKKTYKDMKSNKRVTFHLFREKLPLKRPTSKLCSRWCPRLHQVCPVSEWNSQGLRFYKWGRIFHFPIDFWMDVTILLPVIRTTLIKRCKQTVITPQCTDWRR